jgi:hypothetical protein
MLHLQAFARLFFGESPTMASECAMLGVPAIFLSTSRRVENGMSMIWFTFSDLVNGSGRRWQRLSNFRTADCRGAASEAPDDAGGLDRRERFHREHRARVRQALTQDADPHPQRFPRLCLRSSPLKARKLWGIFHPN